MKSTRLYSMIALSGTMFGAEIVASHVTQSLALLICAYHMLYNILSLLLLVISHRTSKGGTLKNTFGWARVKVLGMLVNMLFLCALCFAACVEAVQTMVHASHENTEPQFPFLLLCLGILNFTLNLVSFLLIGGYTHHQGCSMIVQGEETKVNYVLSDNDIVGTSSEMCHSASDKNLKKKIVHEKNNEYESHWEQSVSSDHKLLDMTRDASSSLAVIVCACVILLFDGLILKYADSILAMASVAILMTTTYPFIRETGLILLQSIPNNIDISGLQSRLRKEFPDIENIHDFHVWRLTASEVIATVHIIISSADIFTSISSKLDQFFEKEGISLVTIQPEFQKQSWKAIEGDCILRCSSNNNCGALTCCGPAVTTARHRNNCANSPPPELVQTEVVMSSCGDANTHIKSHRSSQNADIDLPSACKYDFSRFKTATETSV